MTRKRKILFWAIFLGINLTILEGLSFVVLKRFGTLAYNPNSIQQSVDSYLKRRDPVLGWNKSVDERNNSRPGVNEASYQDGLIDLYGDSFTRGDEVEDHEAWSYLSSHNLGVNIVNQGVGGYGSDQAFLKFRTNPNPAKIVVLNHCSENIIRNVNQFRAFIYPSSEISLKPRFIIQEDRLDLVELPEINSNTLSDIITPPHPLLNHEYFKPLGPSGLQIMHFPFTLKLVSAGINHWKTTQRLGTSSAYQPFYRKEHPSQGYQVTKQILAEFHRLALERECLPVVTIIPPYRDFQFFDQHGEFPYAKLLSDLATEGVAVVDFGAELRSLHDGDMIDLYLHPRGHMNPKGHHYLATAFSSHLQSTFPQMFGH